MEIKWELYKNVFIKPNSLFSENNAKWKKNYELDTKNAFMPGYSLVVTFIVFLRKQFRKQVECYDAI